MIRFKELKALVRRELRRATPKRARIESLVNQWLNRNAKSAIAFLALAAIAMPCASGAEPTKAQLYRDAEAVLVLELELAKSKKPVKLPTLAEVMLSATADGKPVIAYPVSVPHPTCPAGAVCATTDAKKIIVGYQTATGITVTDELPPDASDEAILKAFKKAKARGGPVAEERDPFFIDVMLGLAISSPPCPSCPDGKCRPSDGKSRLAGDDPQPDYPDYEPSKPVVPFTITFDEKGKPIITYGSVRESESSSAASTAKRAACSCNGKLPCECGDSCRCLSETQATVPCWGGRCDVGCGSCSTCPQSGCAASFPQPMAGPGPVVRAAGPLQRTRGFVGRFFFPWRR